MGNVSMLRPAPRQAGRADGFSARSAMPAGGRSRAATEPALRTATRPSSDWARRGGERPLPASAREALGAPGRALSAAERGIAGPMAGLDLGRVRILDGPAAARGAAELHADAYAFGDKVAFATGKYRPGSPASQALLRHELTHVAQQRGSANRTPRAVAPSDAPAERAARTGASGILAAGDLVHCQDTQNAPAPQQNQQIAKPAPRSTEETPGPRTTPTDQKPDPKPDEDTATDAKAALRKRVRDWLKLENFDMPLIFSMKPPIRMMYSGQLWTLDQITDDTYDVLQQTDKSIKRSDVWMEVWQCYGEKRDGRDPTGWNVSVQLLWQPTYALASSQPLTGSRWSNPTQLSAGWTSAQHPSGSPGLEHQLSLNLSTLNIGSGHTDFFQNLLGQYQASHVFPIGSQFRLDGEWATVTGSIYSQLALGAGWNYATPPGGTRQAYIGFLGQAGAGGQVIMSIGWFSVVVNGTLVYSYAGKTSQTPTTHTLSGQAGIGFQGQWGP